MRSKATVMPLSIQWGPKGHAFRLDCVPEHHLVVKARRVMTIKSENLVIKRFSFRDPIYRRKNVLMDVCVNRNILSQYGSFENAIKNGVADSDSSTFVSR